MPCVGSRPVARDVAQDLALNLKVETSIEFFHPFGQQSGQPRIVLGAGCLNGDVALVIHHIGGDGVELPRNFRLSPMFSAIVVLGAVGSISLAAGLASVALRAAFDFIQLGLAGVGDGAVDAAGQRRGLGHQRAGSAQGGGGGVDVAFCSRSGCAVGTPRPIGAGIAQGRVDGSISCRRTMLSELRVWPAISATTADKSRSWPSLSSRAGRSWPFSP